MAVEDYRYGYLLYVARAIERSNNYRPVSKINVNKVDSPPVPKGDKLNLLKITEFGPDLGEPHKESRPRPSLWLVGGKGKVLSSNTQQPLPTDWDKLKIPKKIHAIESHNEIFIFDPKIFIIKLDTTPMTYLVSRNEKTLFQGPYLLIQGTHTFTTAALAVFLALSISFYYLRRKSLEARKVLTKLGSGDLKARFEIKKFDEFGSLILDFNQMAGEIERLVMKLRETEVSRSHLLQELGHDLRTPLTSLSTAFETMNEHHEVLSAEEKKELYSVIGTDIRYFKDLLEKLTLVATIDGPHYKSSTEKINLHQLLQEEVQSRQLTTAETLGWKLIHDKEKSPTIFGDAHLITRLFRNAFDNATRYAQHSITVQVNDQKEKVEILVMDDGPGLSEESLNSFGKRRERRQRKDHELENFSLGLGSVIMKTITQVHGGQLEILNLLTNGKISGACLRIIFQKT
jgi:signal transduction histidine kinase